MDLDSNLAITRKSASRGNKESSVVAGHVEGLKIRTTSIVTMNPAMNTVGDFRLNTCKNLRGNTLLAYYIDNERR